MKENNKSQTVTADILQDHQSKSFMCRKSFEDLIEKSRKSSPKKIFCLCYVELYRSSLSENVKDLAVSNYKISIINIHSIFLPAGVHFNEDIQTIVSDLNAIYHHLKFKINNIVGNNSTVSNAILKVVTL